MKLNSGNLKSWHQFERRREQANSAKAIHLSTILIKVPFGKLGQSHFDNSVTFVNIELEKQDNSSYCAFDGKLQRN